MNKNAKILYASANRPFGLFLVFLAAILIIRSCESLFSEHTLIATTLQDTSASHVHEEYNLPTQTHIKETRTNDISKGTIVKVLSTQDDFTSTPFGKIKSTHLSTPEMGYLAKPYKPFVVFVCWLLCFGAFNLFLMRLIAACSAMHTLKKQKFNIPIDNILQSIKGKETTFAAIANVIITIVLTFGSIYKLQALSLTYASCDNNGLMTTALSQPRQYASTTQRI